MNSLTLFRTPSTIDMIFGRIVPQYRDYHCCQFNQVFPQLTHWSVIFIVRFKDMECGIKLYVYQYHSFQDIEEEFVTFKFSYKFHHHQLKRKWRWFHFSHSRLLRNGAPSTYVLNTTDPSIKLEFIYRVIQIRSFHFQHSGGLYTIPNLFSLKIPSIDKWLQ